MSNSPSFHFLEKNFLFNSKTILVIAIILFTAAFYFYGTSNSLLNQAVDPFTSPNWDEVANRNIVKNSIPIILLDETFGGKCLVSAENFSLITSHQYFLKSNQLSNELKYDSNEKTLLISCDKLVGEKSALNVWYATEEAKKHPTKYEYFVTEWNVELNEK